jgi:hypothetical protein
MDYNEIGWDGLSETDKGIVEDLAKSCFYINGYATLKARMIWANAEPGLDYDDMVICSSGANKGNEVGVFDEINNYSNSMDEKIFTKEHSVKLNEVKVYPNPANNILYILYDMPNVSNLKIELYDDIGKKIKEIQCNNCNGITTIDVTDVANGLYHIKIKADNALFKVDKIIILR